MTWTYSKIKSSPDTNTTLPLELAASPGVLHRSVPEDISRHVICLIGTIPQGFLSPKNWSDTEKKQCSPRIAWIPHSAYTEKQAGQLGLDIDGINSAFAKMKNLDDEQKYIELINTVSSALAKHGDLGCCKGGIFSFSDLSSLECCKW